MSAALPEGLLVDVQRRLETLYALEPEAPVTDFLVPEEAAATYPGGGSRTLLAQAGEDVVVGVILDASVCAGLSRDPRVRLDGENLGALCALAEEVSHFVYLLFCARSGRTITQLELELQGEVDKFITAVCLLSLQNEGAVSARLRELLFQRYRLKAHVESEDALRYRAASRLAWTYCGWLEEAFLRRARLADLCRESRRFYRLGQREKLERIAELA